MAAVLQVAGLLDGTQRRGTTPSSVSGRAAGSPGRGRLGAGCLANTLARGGMTWYDGIR